MVPERKDATPEAALIRVVYVSLHTRFLKPELNRTGSHVGGILAVLVLESQQGLRYLLKHLRIMYNFIWLNIKANLGKKLSVDTQSLF